ncbi:hypothetical protein FOMPIDRAFT_1056647 [Fomitopsis schrenkii]|uniref:Uncharacterized protein n=1 Tax=Fomitopsis schrenkii TaxID=2126942 RepID=S8DIP4_FOMSC|nr:hypothetical protein FOMPIDRAFT_1056647 [Fomitopsis schrenkii]
MATTQSFGVQAVKNVTSRIPTTSSPEVLANHSDELSCNNNLNAEEDDLEGTLKKVAEASPIVHCKINNE